ncbi:MAG TPA: ABC transporter substrate-binding protein [Kiritimatiellia bacterium]|nr:ABC transporter substrate-binding protein [Kiritimatiellia bacterium]HSA17502.1 ABC transporter substrate-binding protein [Kiritimatiellia bacterium]
MNRKNVITVVVVLAVVIVGAIVFKSRQEQAPGQLTIGAILPMTGAASGYGKWMQRGVQLAVEDINAAGGVAGRKIQVIVEDSKSDNRAGVDAANKLITVDNVAALEVALTGVTKSVMPIADRQKMIVFTSATAPGLTDDSEYLFRNATNIRNEVDRMTRACLGTLGIKRVSVISVNNPVGPWVNDYFKREFEAAGGEVPDALLFQPDATDFRTQLEKIRLGNPQALYILGYQSTGLIMKQARELGLQCQFLGITDFELPEVLQIAGEAADGAIYTKAAYDPGSEDPHVAAYAKKYEERYGEPPEVYSATVYDATRILAEAFREAGNDPQALRQYILAIKDYPGASGITTFMQNGDVTKPVQLKKIDAISYVLIEE